MGPGALCLEKRQVREKGTSFHIWVPYRNGHRGGTCRYFWGVPARRASQGGWPGLWHDTDNGSSGASVLWLVRLSGIQFLCAQLAFRHTWGVQGPRGWCPWARNRCRDGHSAFAFGWQWGRRSRQVRRARGSVLLRRGTGTSSCMGLTLLWLWQGRDCAFPPFQLQMVDGGISSRRVPLWRGHEHAVLGSWARQGFFRICPVFWRRCGWECGDLSGIGEYACAWAWWWCLYHSRGCERNGRACRAVCPGRSRVWLQDEHGCGRQLDKMDKDAQRWQVEHGGDVVAADQQACWREDHKLCWMPRPGDGRWQDHSVPAYGCPDVHFHEQGVRVSGHWQGHGAA